MAQDLVVPQGFGQLAPCFSGSFDDADELARDITSGYAVLAYRGKVWRLKHRGSEVNIVNSETGDPVGSIEVVIVKSSSTRSKSYYANGWVDGSTAAPTCWSSNAITPDANVPEPQSPSCLSCPLNVFGSRITETGNKAKACSDYKRVAVVPLNDMANEAHGGAMLLRIPAASLGDAAIYATKLKGLGYPVHAVGTRLRFDINESYPKLLFEDVRALTQEEGVYVLELRKDPRIAQIVSETSEHEVATSATAGAPESPAEAAKQPTPQPAIRPAPHATQQADQPVKVTPTVSTRPAPSSSPPTAPARPTGKTTSLGGISAAIAQPQKPTPASSPARANTKLRVGAPPAAPAPQQPELPLSDQGHIEEAGVLANLDAELEALL